MLQFKSFNIKKGEEISQFLRDKTLAKDATILITNGFIGIPYEDGNPATIPQRIIRLKEEANREKEKSNFLSHNKRELEVTIHGIKEEIKKCEERIETSKTKDEKRDRELRRETEKDIQRFQNMIINHENSLRGTMAEITRLEVSIAVYNEEIHQLKNA